MTTVKKQGGEPSEILPSVGVCFFFLIFIFCSVGEPAEKDLPAGGAASQWNAAEGWVGAEMQVWNTSVLLFC